MVEQNVILLLKTPLNERATKSTQCFSKQIYYIDDKPYINSCSHTQEIIYSFLQALYLKSPREESHSERVAELCVILGEALCLDSNSIYQLHITALLHDIGKIFVDRAILDKPSKLTKFELESIREHPLTGFQILNTYEELSLFTEAIFAHHERWDGNGYPKGLVKEQIPLFSRIIALADAFDAMVSERPYKQPLSIEEAIIEIEKNKGKQFDPKLAEMFIQAVSYINIIY